MKILYVEDNDDSVYMLKNRLTRAGFTVVVATDGDNTNIVIGQVAQKRFANECVVVRLLDPARAAFYRARGLRVVCPTETAIAEVTDAVRACEIPQPREGAASA